MLAELNDQLGQLLKILAKDTLRITATAKLEGYTNAEIAIQFDVAERTIERRLQLPIHLFILNVATNPWWVLR